MPMQGFIVGVDFGLAEASYICFGCKKEDVVCAKEQGKAVSLDSGECLGLLCHWCAFNLMQMLLLCLPGRKREFND